MAAEGIEPIIWSITRILIGRTLLATSSKLCRADTPNRPTRVRLLTRLGDDEKFSVPYMLGDFEKAVQH